MTTLRPFPDHDTPQALDFLSNFHRSGPWHVANKAGDGRLYANTYTETSSERLTEWIEEQQGETNVYFTVNKLRPDIVNRKACKSDVAAIVALHVDVDDPSALERMQSFSPRPTVIVFSGGGYQAFWRLTEPSLEIDRAEAVNKMLAKRHGGDNCWNCDRLMRLPGTINMPDAKKLARGRTPALAYVVDADWTRTYSLDDFVLDGPEPAGPKGSIAAKGSVQPVGISNLPATIIEDVRRVIEAGDDLSRPIGSEAARFPSRSEAVFFVCCALAKEGCTDDAIAGVLINADLRISDSVLEKRSSVSYALKQARSARAAVELGWPDTGPKGLPRSTMRNAAVALRRLGIGFSFDMFRYRKIMSGVALEEHAGEISDDACMFIRGLVIETFNFDPKSENVRDAVRLLCLENAFHPICDMLNSLKWDGLPRIDHWLHRYLGAADTPLNAAISRIMLVAAVRRVRMPGTKFDQIIVLEGAQGSGKSTALQILAGAGNHSDQEILTLDAKQQMELMEGVWIYELGEVEGINKAEVNKIKAFASRRVDRARMAYAQFAAERPRQNILVGTTNDDKYLRDQTGNRRFWPVKTGQIDLEAFEQDRDQIWAEAALREQAGESIKLPEELWEAAESEQAARLEDDPWIDKLTTVRGHAAGDVAQISTADLLSEKLLIPLERQNQSHTKRLASIMRKLGWVSAKWRVGGQVVRGYQRLKPADHRDDIKI